MDYLFVHGTLRRGGDNNSILSDSAFLGHAKTAQQYALYLINRKPLVTKLPTSTIKGEVYSVTDEMLLMVDRFSGHPSVNRRELVSIQFEDGRTVDAWLYFYIQPLHNPTLIESGEYTELKR
jgi:gamma-glutamylcyclotransferase (GGCT)/AIG2-like uncharacterized protein YtfP